MMISFPCVACMAHLSQAKDCQFGHGSPEQEQTGFPGDEGRLYPAARTTLHS